MQRGEEGFEGGVDDGRKPIDGRTDRDRGKGKAYLIPEGRQ